MTDTHNRIRRIKQQLSLLGPVLPGTLSTQWNVCGKPGCKCKDSTKPRKHGPYYQLSFTLDGKSSTVFVKKEDLSKVRQCSKRYQRFRALNNELLKAYVQWVRDGGLDQTGDTTHE